MTLDRSYIENNRASTERIRQMARLSDAEMQTRVGEHWTVAIVLAHLAFWDRRVLYVLDRTEQDGKLFIPNLDIVINDLSLPLWAAIPPRDALRLAVETGDVDRVGELVSSLGSEQEALGRRLKELAERYEYQTILELLTTEEVSS